MNTNKMTIKNGKRVFIVTLIWLESKLNEKCNLKNKIDKLPKINSNQ